MIASEVKNGRTYTYNKQFYIRVIDKDSISPDNPFVPIDEETGEPIIPKQLDKNSLARENKDKNKPLPYVIDFDATSLMTIGWTRKLIPPEDYPEIPKAKTKVQI